MPDIDAKARNVRELLGGKKYTIDYFQREYRWQEKQISELVTDLTSRFLSAYRPGHGRADVAKYPLLPRLDYRLQRWIEDERD